MTSSLVRCSTCKRHIYASESECPFCARAAMATSGSIAVALTAAASIALAGCANDSPKNDPSTNVAPEAQKPDATQTIPNSNPAPVVAPVVTPKAVATEPVVVPVPATATAPVPPVTTNPAPTQVNPKVSPVPAYGLPRPTTTVTAPRKPPSSAYGAPPPMSDPLK